MSVPRRGRDACAQIADEAPRRMTEEGGPASCRGSRARQWADGRWCPIPHRLGGILMIARAATILVLLPDVAAADRAAEVARILAMTPDAAYGAWLASECTGCHGAGAVDSTGVALCGQ